MDDSLHQTASPFPTGWWFGGGTGSGTKSGRTAVGEAKMTLKHRWISDFNIWLTKSMIYIYILYVKVMRKSRGMLFVYQVRTLLDGIVTKWLGSPPNLSHAEESLGHKLSASTCATVSLRIRGRIANPPGANSGHWSRLKLKLMLKAQSACILIYVQKYI